MNATSIEALSDESSELDNSFKKITCAFYDKCTLPKNDSLCNQFPDFMICPDYKEKRKKILNE